MGRRTFLEFLLQKSQVRGIEGLPRNLRLSSIVYIQTREFSLFYDMSLALQIIA
jgi:hypothetical protein